MPKFIPREKLSKKARRALDAEKRAAWGFSPVTRKVENKKYYDRKKQPPVRDDDPAGAVLRPPLPVVPGGYRHSIQELFFAAYNERKFRRIDSYSYIRINTGKF